MINEEGTRVKMNNTKKKEQYPLLDSFDGIGKVEDTEKGNLLIVTIKVQRDVYSDVGYFCNEEAPELLHQCVENMFDKIFEMPVIKTATLTPDLIWEGMPEHGKTEESRERYGAMALCALWEAMQDYLRKRNQDRGSK